MIMTPVAYGYQSMLAQIQVDTINAELERDRQIAGQMEKLLAKDEQDLVGQVFHILEHFFRTRDFFEKAISPRIVELRSIQKSNDNSDK